MGEILNRRRNETQRRIKKLRTKLAETETYCQGKACVYVTGSYGRREASRHSDLDLFIVGYGTVEKPALSGLDEILVKADLIHVTKSWIYVTSRVMVNISSITRSRNSSTLGKATRRPGKYIYRPLTATAREFPATR